MLSAIKRRAITWLESTKRPVGNGEGDVFFWRYRLLQTRFLSIFVHDFKRSDSDRCVHDHPWPFLTVILRGGYWEVDRAGVYRWYRPGSVLLRRATWAHRIAIRIGTRPLSLVLTGPKVRQWGFHTLTGWKPWAPGASPICETDDPRLDDPSTFDNPEAISGEFPVPPEERAIVPDDHMRIMMHCDVCDLDQAVDLRSHSQRVACVACGAAIPTSSASPS